MYTRAMLSPAGLHKNAFFPSRMFEAEQLNFTPAVTVRTSRLRCHLFYAKIERHQARS